MAPVGIENQRDHPNYPLAMIHARHDFDDKHIQICKFDLTWRSSCRFVLMMLSLLTLLAGICLLTSTAYGQDQSDSEKKYEVDKSPRMTGAGGAAGIGMYPADTWGVIATTITNPSNDVKQLLVTFAFDGTENLQFAKPVWMPPLSRRRVYLPMRTADYVPLMLRSNQSARRGHYQAGNASSKKPEEFQVAKMTLGVTQQLLDTSTGQEVVLTRSQGTLLKARDRWITGMLSDDDAGYNGNDVTIEAVLASRHIMDMSRRMAYLRAKSLPSLPEGWHGLNALVISARLPDMDDAQLAACRQWILSGGRLWIMLDQVEPDFVARLMGTAWSCEIVDQVPLTHVRLEPTDSSLYAGSTQTVEVPANKRTSVLIELDDDGEIVVNGKAIGIVSDPTLVPSASARKTLENLNRPVLAKLGSTLRQLAESNERSQVVIANVQFAGGASGEQVKLVTEVIRSSGFDSLSIEREHENPVDMVRVLPGSMEVLHTVDGWPASMRTQFGKGSVLVTTLGARGWMEEVFIEQIGADGSIRKANDGQTKFTHGAITNQELEDIASWFHGQEAAATLDPTAFDSFLDQQVGFEIVSRSTIVVLLALYCGAMGLTAVIFWRKDRLEYLALIGCGYAVIATVVLLFVGYHNLSSVPLTVAQGQFIEVAPNQQHLLISERAHVFMPENVEQLESGDTSEGSQAGTQHAGRSGTAQKGDHHEQSFATTAGGLIWPASMNTGQINRMVWTDFDQWNWQNMELATGVTRASAVQITPVRDPIRATMTFGETGIEGVFLKGNLGEITDPVIATRVGHLIPTLNEDGTFTGGVEQTQSAGLYMPGNVTRLGDLQIQHQLVYRKLLGDVPSIQADDALSGDKRGSPRRGHAGRKTDSQRDGYQVSDSVLPKSSSHQQLFPTRPTLLVWTPPINTGFNIASTTQTKGAALVSVPLEIHRPASGQHVAVPSPFLPFTLVRQRGRATVLPYNSQDGQWISVSSHGDARIRFQLPSELLPMTVTGGQFLIDVRAAGRPIEILAEVNRDNSNENEKSTEMSLHKGQSPESQTKVKLPKDIAVDARGGVTIILRVGPTDNGDRTIWRVRHASLSVSGVTE